MSEHKICDCEGNPIIIDDNVVIVDERGDELDLRPLRELDENAYFLLPSKSEKPELYVFGGLFANKNVSYKKKNSEASERQELSIENNLKKQLREEVSIKANEPKENPIERFFDGGKTQKIEEHEGQNLIPTIASIQNEKATQVVSVNNYESEFSENEEQEYYESLKESYEYPDNEYSYEYYNDEIEHEGAESEYFQNEEFDFEEETVDDKINNELNAEIFPGENIISPDGDLDINFDTDSGSSNTQIDAGTEISFEENNKLNMLDNASLNQKNILIENDTKSILDADKKNPNENSNKKPKKFKVEYDDGYFF